MRDIRCLIAGTMLGLLVPAVAADCETEHRPPDVHCSPLVTVTADADGRLWRVWADREHLYLQSSADGGRTFDPPLQVNADPEPITTDPENRPRLGVHGTHVIVVWSRPGEQRFTSDLRIARSADGGNTFTAPENVNTDGLDVGHSFADLAVDGEGRLTIAWLDGRDRYVATQAGEAFTGSSLYLTRAAGLDQPLAPERSLAQGTCECCRLATAVLPDGDTLIMWRHIFDGQIRDHALGRLSEDGFQWRRAEFEHWRVEGCPHQGPALAAGGDGRIHAAWFTGAGERFALLYRAFEADWISQTANGAPEDHQPLPFGDPQRQPTRPAVAAHGERIALAWCESDNGRALIRAQFSDDGGTSWSAPDTVATARGRADHPQLLVLDGVFILSWHNTENGHQVLHLPRP